MAFGVVPAALVGAQWAAWAWLGLVAALVGLDAWIAPSPRALTASRRSPAPVRLTETATAGLTLANTGRRTITGVVRDAWQPSAGADETRHRFRVRPGQEASLRTLLTPTRRGDRVADRVTVRTNGPLRLAGRQRSLEADASVRVLPPFVARKYLPSRMRRLREIEGQTAIRMGGAGSEFDSLREYVPGDDVRTIDWMATARHADVIVRTFRPERDRRLMLVLDTSRLSAVRVGDAPRLDASIEATLLLAALAVHAGDRVQMVAYDRVERARAATLVGSDVLATLGDAIAPIEPSLVEPDWSGVVRLARSRLSQRSLVVLLTTVETSAVDSGLLDAVATLSKDHVVAIASVEDPEETAMAALRGDAESVYAAASAARSALERDAIAERLRHVGGHVVTSTPEDLAPDLADQYLALKASGLL